MSDLQVRNNADESRYETEIEGETAVLEYELSGSEINFTHTHVPRAGEGKGVGKALVVAALAEARARNLHVRADCPFVSGYLAKHPEYADLTSPRGDRQE